MRKIFVLIIILVFSSCKAIQSNVLNVSKELYKKNINYYNAIEVKKSEQKSLQIRKKIINSNKLDFILLHDTIFLIEGFKLETNERYTCIWNKSDILSYKFSNGAYEITQQLISDELKDLIAMWNIDGIKEKQKENGIMFGGLVFDVSKIILNQEKTKISHIDRFEFEQYE